MTAVALVHKADILRQLASGKRLSDIAPTYGVSVNAVSKALKADPDYRDAIETSFEVRLDAAESAILDAAEQVDVSRARAYHDALKWRAGAEVPSRWGQRTQVDINVDIGTELQQLCRQLSSNGGNSGGNSESLTIEHEDNQDVT